MSVDNRLSRRDILKLGLSTAVLGVPAARWLLKVTEGDKSTSENPSYAVQYSPQNKQVEIWDRRVEPFDKIGCLKLDTIDHHHADNLSASNIFQVLAKGNNTGTCTEMKTPNTAIINGDEFTIQYENGLPSRYTFNDERGYIGVTPEKSGTIIRK